MPTPITVVIPTYQGSRYVESALSSVYGQTQPPHEIIVVDDASEDGTPELVEKSARHSPVPVRLIRMPRNSGGPAAPMNAGVAACTTPFVATLDQDDLMTPIRLAVQGSALDAHPEAPAVIGMLAKIDAEGNPCLTDSEAETRNRILSIANQFAGDCYLLEPAAFYRYALHRGTLTIATVTCFRVTAWQAVGGFAARFRIAWDLDFTCQLARLGPLACVDKVVGAYRMHSANTSRQGLDCRREVARVVAEHVARPWLPIDREESRRKAATLYFGLGYDEALLGNRWASLQAYATAWRLGMSARSSLTAAAKGLVRSLLKV